MICCHFTELTDEEFYECLRWANTTLMKNYFDRQRNSTLTQINNLYKNKDASFRGFRHHSGAGSGHTGEALKMKAKAVEGTEIMDGLTNWEASQTEDAERFSQRNDTNNGSKTLKSFDAYLKRKEYRKSLKKRGYEKI